MGVCEAVRRIASHLMSEKRSNKSSQREGAIN
jgi:hypothetical protein